MTFARTVVPFPESYTTSPLMTPLDVDLQMHAAPSMNSEPNPALKHSTLSFNVLQVSSNAALVLFITLSVPSENQNIVFYEIVGFTTSKKQVLAAHP